MVESSNAIILDQLQKIKPETPKPNGVELNSLKNYKNRRARATLKSPLQLTTPEINELLAYTLHHASDIWLRLNKKADFQQIQVDLKALISYFKKLQVHVKPEVANNFSLVEKLVQNSNPLEVIQRLNRELNRLYIKQEKKRRRRDMAAHFQSDWFYVPAGSIFGLGFLVTFGCTFAYFMGLAGFTLMLYAPIIIGAVTLAALTGVALITLSPMASDLSYELIGIEDHITTKNFQIEIINKYYNNNLINVTIAEKIEDILLNCTKEVFRQSNTENRSAIIKAADEGPSVKQPIEVDVQDDIEHESNIIHSP